MKRINGKEASFLGEEKEFLVRYSKEYIEQYPDIDYFIYGHRHIMLDLKLNHNARMLILGDWIWQFSYAVFDGEHLFLEQYVEGDTYLG